MNFCPRCGTRVVGNFCMNCGAPTTVPGEPAAHPGTAHEPSVIEAPATSATTNDPPTPEPSMSDPPAQPMLRVNPAGQLVGGLPVGAARRSLVAETRVVMIAFLVPGVVGAVIVLAQHVAGVDDVARFATIVKHRPVLNMALGILDYLTIAAVVPLALYLLARTGQDRKTLGLEFPRFKRDLLPAVGIGAASYVSEIVLIAPFAIFLASHQSLLVSVSTQSVPKYYVIWGLAISATTAVTEEVLVNGYLITRLGQMGWTPRSALILSLILRTSYHIYYGAGFILTVPFGFFVTRSFQKHHRLTRPMLAHFLFDAVLISISILR